MSGNFEPSSAINERSTSTSRFSIPKRYVQAFLASLALFIIQWRRSSFLDILTHIFASTYRTEQEYNWKPEDAEWMNAAFSWGCIVAQIPGALLTIKFGSHRILFASMLVTTVFNIIVPMTFSKHIPVVIIIRILQGISEGPIYPACVGIWKSWAPPSERSTLFSIVLCGSYFGSVVGLPANRALAENFGETACFLISSIFGLIWCLVWMTHTYESPSSHPHISHSELAYLEENVDADNRLEVTVKSVPWLSILKSLPVWLISLANFCYACSTFVLMILPFMDNRIEVEFAKGKVIEESKSEKTATSIVQQKILDQVLPNIIIGVVVSLSGFFADFLINRAYLSRSTVRKLYCSGGFTLHGIAFLIIRYYYNTDSTVICMNLAHGFLGLSAVGFLVNCFDLSPCYASIVMAICQVLGNLGSEITNLILYKVSNHWTSSDVYDTVISVSFVIALMYACFGSGNMQWWGKPEATRAVAVEDESARSTYYSYPDGADRVDLIVDGCELQPSTASTELGN